MWIVNKSDIHTHVQVGLVEVMRNISLYSGGYGMICAIMSEVSGLG